MIDIKPIKTKKQYQQYLDWVDEMFDKKIRKGSPEGDALEVILILIKNYEDKHYPVPVPDAIEVLKLKMKEKGIKNKDLVGLLGSKSHVSNILSKRKILTLENARILHKELGVSADVLLS